MPPQRRGHHQKDENASQLALTLALSRQARHRGEHAAQVYAGHRAGNVVIEAVGVRWYNMLIDNK